MGFSVVNVAGGSIDALLQQIFAQSVIRQTSTAAGLTTTLDTGLYGGRTNVEITVNSNAAPTTFTVSGSADNVNWTQVDTIQVTTANTAVHKGYGNAYRYIKVATAAANNNTIEIVASR
jgi:hypothetical protein